MRQQCTCGLLTALASRFDTAIYFRGHSCFLRLSQEQEVELAYCPHCASQDRTCGCSALAQWAKAAPGVVIRDAELEEHRLKFGEVEVPVRFCPQCGGAVPPSKRSTLHMPRSQEEEKYITRLLANAKNLEDVVAILGKPDFESGPIDLPQGQDPSRFIPVRRSYEFLRTTKTLRIIVQELANGKLRLIFGGKPWPDSARTMQ